MNKFISNNKILFLFTVSLLFTLPFPTNAESNSSLFSEKASKEKYFCKRSESLKNLEKYAELNEMELAHILEAKTNQVDKLRNLLGKKLSAKDKTGLSLLTRIKKLKPVLRKQNLETLFQDHQNLLKLNRIISSDF